MKAELVLTHRFVKKHLRQCMGAVLGISIFASAIFTVLALRACTDASVEKKRFDTFGYYSGITYDVNKSKLAAQNQNLHAAGAGITSVTGEIKLPDLAADEIPYIGSIDGAALKMKNIQVIKGRLPKNKNEVAIEDSTVRKLGLAENIGETISLRVTDLNGTSTQRYVLSGILSDYLDLWHQLDKSNLDTSNISAPIKVPGILSANNESPVITANVLFSLSVKAETWNLGGHYVANSNSIYTSPVETREKSTADLLGAILTIFLVLMIVLGIHNIISITRKGREKYIGLLRCIGLTSRQTFFIFFLQGVYLAFTADILSALLGTVFFHGAVWISGAIGQPLVTVISWQPYFIALTICTATILLVFMGQAFSIFKKQPLEYGTFKAVKKEKKRELLWNLPALWNKANRALHKSQNGLTIALISACVFLLIFGAFYAEFGAKTLYAGKLEYCKGADYTLNVVGGTTSPTTLYTAFPRGEGISPKNIQKLRNTDGLNINFAAITLTSKQFVLIPKDETNPDLLQLKSVRPFAVDQPTKQIQSKFGYHQDDTLSETEIVGMDSEDIKKLNGCITSGRFDPDKFTSAEEILTIGTGLHVGDHVTITGVVFSPETTMDQVQGKPKIHTINAKVGAVLSLDKGNLPNKNLVPIHNGIIMSAKYMIQTDPFAKYDNVAISNTKPENQKVTKAAADEVYHIFAQSYNMQMTDVAKERKAWQDMANQSMALVDLLVMTFMLIVLSAFAVTTNLKAKTSLHSYILMRAVGLDDSQLKKLLYYDNIKTSVTGILIGAVFGFGLCIYFSRMYIYYSSVDVFLTVLIPLFLISSALIMAISILACISPVKKILREPIVSALSDLDI